MSGYTKPCIFCKLEIKMSNDGGKWLPYNLDGTLHECRESRKDKVGNSVTPHKEEKKSTLNLEDLDTRLKRVEATLFGE